ncbi:MAG: TolC family protein [Rhizobiaceae bacterium]
MSIGLLLTSASVWASDGGTLFQLRGSSNDYQVEQSTQLRGSQSQNGQQAEPVYVSPPPQTDSDLPGVEVDTDDGETQHASGSAGEDVGSALSFLRRNFIPTLLFRGPKRAISDRSISYTIPSRASLRHSMLHSANMYEGLRGAEAGVGDTIALALRGSYSARAQIEGAAADRARVHGALANFLPKINGTVNASYASQEGSSSYSDRVEQITTGIEVSMPLYASGVNVNTYKQAKHVSLASDHSYLAEEYRVALEAVAAHINLRLNRRIERTLQTNVAAMKRIAHIARKLYEAGDASRTDIAIARANVESARAEVDLARKTREETLSDYESFTGSYAPAKLLAPSFASYVPATAEQAVQMAVSNNPALVASLHTALASGYAAKIERGKYGPKVDLYGAYNEPLYTSSATDQQADWNIGVRLKVPLFDATLAPSVGAARHEALEAQYRALEQARVVERQVRRQWTAYKSADRRVKIVARQVRAVSASVEGARREYEAGFRSISDVLNDQVKLARAKITLESARHEQMLAAYEIAFTTAHPSIRHLAGSRASR